MSVVHELAEVLQNAATCLGGEVYEFSPSGGPSEFSALAAIRGEWTECRYHVTLFEAPDGHPHLTVAVEGRFDFELSLHPEGRWDWLKVSLGQMTDIRVGVPAIDDRYTVAGQPQGAAIDFLRQVDVQDSLEFLQPFLQLSIEHGMLRIIYDASGTVDWTLDHLCRIVARVVTLTTFSTS